MDPSINNSREIVTHPVRRTYIQRHRHCRRQRSIHQIRQHICFNLHGMERNAPYALDDQLKGICSTFIQKSGNPFILGVSSGSAQ